MPRTNDMEREMNEQSGNSGQLPPDAGSGGDALLREILDVATRTSARTLFPPSFADRVRAALAARQPVGVEPVAPQSIPEGWALVDLSSYAVLPQLPGEQIIAAGWPAGEMISECFDSLGAYADLIASYSPNGSGIVHGKGQPAPAAVPVDVSTQEMEWLHYAIDHMLDDSEPEDQACAKALQALVSRLVANHCFATHPQPAAATDGDA